MPGSGQSKMLVGTAALAGDRLAEAEDTDMAKKAKRKNPKQGAKKITVKAKLSAKKKAPKKKAPAQKTRKQNAIHAARKRPARQKQVVLGSQSLETVQLRPRARVAASRAGAGDFDRVSAVESADSESPDELLEEGQAFEAGIVAGVQNAPDPDQGEVRTREVPEDDVPEEYDDDRP
jgi:hypothetical protein